MSDALLWITAVGSISTACATIGLVVVGGRALVGTRDQVKLLREQTEREGRPYVVLNVVPGLHGPGSWDLTIRNAGRTMAQDILIIVEGLVPQGETDYISTSLKKYLSSPRSLAPGTSQRVMWRAEADTETGAVEAGAPGQAMAEASYHDSQGAKYKERFDLSVDLLGAISPAPTQGPRARGEHKELANIERALRTLNQHVGEIRR